MVLELGITPLIIRVIRVTADSSSKILSDQGHPRKYTCSTRFGCMQARQNVTTNARGLIGRGGRGRVESKGKEVGARRGGRESSFQKMGQTRSRLGRKRRGVISFRLSVVSQAAASLRWLASSTVRHTVELVRHWTTDVAASPSSFHTPPENFQRGPFSLLVSRHRRGRDRSVMLRHGVHVGFLVVFVSVFARRGTGCAFCERMSQQQSQLRQLQQLSQQQPQQQQGYRTIGSPRPFGAEKPTRAQEFNRTGVLHPEYLIPATLRPGNVSQWVPATLFTFLSILLLYLLLFTVAKFIVSYDIACSRNF